MPILTRRTILAGVAASPVAGAGGDSGDPMLALWREWCAVLEEAEGAGEERRRIERDMVERLGYPRVLVARGSGGQPDAYAVDERGVAQALAGAEDREERQARLMAELRAQRERWGAEARRLGLDGAERAEDEAWRRVEALTGRVARVPARSVGGVVAKLAAAVMLRETYGAEASEFPWPILGAALEDLRALAGA